MVDFSYSEEQQLLKDSVERFAREQMIIGRRRELVASDDGFSRDNWAKFAELGWLAVPFSEASGGLGGGPSLRRAGSHACPALQQVVERHRHHDRDRSGTRREAPALVLEQGHDPVGGGEAERLTEVAGGVSGFEWSPDSSKSAFTSRREGDPDRPRNSDIWLIEASEGAEGGPPKYSDYDPDDLTVVSIEGGEPLVLTAKLDRNVHSPRWSQDGARLHFIYADDRVGALAAVPAAGGEIERGLSKPSYVEDRLERMIEWYGKYLLETPEEQSSGGGG